MFDPRCAFCGNINRADAEVCAMCDFPLEEVDNSLGDSPDAFPNFYGPTRAGALPTDIPSPYFQGAGDVIVPTLEVYREYFPLVGLLVLATSIPLAVLDYGVFQILSPRLLHTPSPVFGVSSLNLMFTYGVPGLLVYSLVSLILNSMLAGSLVYAVLELQRTGKASVWDSLRWGAEKLPKVVAVNVFYYVVVYAFPITLMWMTLLTLGAFAYIIFLAAILPWVVATLMFSLVVPAAAAENRGVVGSFKRSVELTEGHKGLIFLTYFLWAVVTTVVSLFIGLSFKVGGNGWTAAAVVIQALVGELLKSTTYVLTTFIFLGILKERRQHLGARGAAHAAP